MKNNCKGIIGENIAAEFLQKKGMRILRRRFFTRVGEIDIIAEYEGEIIFVEVKNRRDPKDAWDAISPRKLQSLEQASQLFFEAYPKYVDKFFRFDVIFVFQNSKLLHIENVHGDGGSEPPLV